MKKPEKYESRTDYMEKVKKWESKKKNNDSHLVVDGPVGRIVPSGV